MHRKFYILALLGLACWQAGVAAAAGVSAANLQQRLNKGEKLTIIDVRPTMEFQESHIPGAINIPASLCSQKHLPPLGKVVVYDAGLGLTQPDGPAAALAAKPGITVEILEGGFAAWESSQATTRAQGMKAGKYNYISYADLKAAKPDEILLVDLREQKPAPRNGSTLNAASQTNQPLTDLALEFPGLRQTRAPIQAKSASQTSAVNSAAPPLLVLIDNGDGKAQQMAQSLKAQGVKRYVILAGGELILARHGQPGLERNSPGHPLLKSLPSNKTTNK